MLLQEGVVKQANYMETALNTKIDYQTVRRKQRQILALDIDKNKKKHTQSGTLKAADRTSKSGADRISPRLHRALQIQ
jgi:hypothetical protein